MNTVNWSGLESGSTPLNDNNLADYTNEENSNEKEVLVKTFKNIEMIINTATAGRKNKG
jgi:hypothetical protein